MTADDMQAREVEVVARIIDGRTGEHMGLDNWRPLAETILGALAPVRAAERQEAAREALRALEERLEPAWTDPDDLAMSDLPAIGYDQFVEAYRQTVRADGVTGREDV